MGFYNALKSDHWKAVFVFCYALDIKVCHYFLFLLNTGTKFIKMINALLNGYMSSHNKPETMTNLFLVYIKKLIYLLDMNRIKFYIIC